jgi:hypothetical protein
MHQGKKLISLGQAAKILQVSRMTLLRWIERKIEIKGRPIQVFEDNMFKKVRRLYLTEESIELLKDRYEIIGESDKDVPFKINFNPE